MKDLENNVKSIRDFIEDNYNTFQFNKVIYLNAENNLDEKVLDAAIDKHIAHNNKAFKKANANAYAQAKKEEGKKEKNVSKRLEVALDRIHQEYTNVVNCPTMLIDVSKTTLKPELLNKIKTMYTYLKRNGINPKIAFQLLDPYKDYRESRMPTILTKEEMENIKNCEKALGFPIYLQEGLFGAPLTTKEVERTNSFVKNIANYLKSLKPSPFEAAVFIHNFCASFFYNDVNKQYGSRVLGDVVSSGNIVCVGYATMFKAIVDELNMHNLTANLNMALLHDKFVFHANNLVSIKDEKYNINGTYMEDTCLSAISEKKYSNFSHCLYPVEDIKNTTKILGYYTKKEKLGSFYSNQTEKIKPLELPLVLLAAIAYKAAGKKLLERCNNKFIEGIDNLGAPISASSYADAYYTLLLKQGYSKKAAASLTDIKIESSIRAAHRHFTKGAKNAFYSMMATPEKSTNRLPSIKEINEKITYLTQLQQKIKDTLLFIETSSDPTDISDALAFNQQLCDINTSIEKLKKQQLNIIERCYKDSTDKYIEENKANKANIGKVLGE